MYVAAKRYGFGRLCLDMEPNERLRTEIQLYMHEHELTPADLAARADVPVEHVEEIIAGQSELLSRNLLAVLDALDVEFTLRVKNAKSTTS